MGERYSGFPRTIRDILNITNGRYAGQRTGIAPGVLFSPCVTPVQDIQGLLSECYSGFPPQDSNALIQDLHGPS